MYAAHPFGMGATVPQQGQASKGEVLVFRPQQVVHKVVLATNKWSIGGAGHKQVVHWWWYQSVQAGSGSYGYPTATPATHPLVPSNQQPERQKKQSGIRMG